MSSASSRTLHTAQECPPARTETRSPRSRAQRTPAARSASSAASSTAAGYRSGCRALNTRPVRAASYPGWPRSANQPVNSPNGHCTPHTSQTLTFAWRNVILLAENIAVQDHRPLRERHGRRPGHDGAQPPGYPQAAHRDLPGGARRGGTRRAARLPHLVAGRASLRRGPAQPVPVPVAGRGGRPDQHDQDRHLRAARCRCTTRSGWPRTRPAWTSFPAAGWNWPSAPADAR